MLEIIFRAIKLALILNFSNFFLQDEGVNLTHIESRPSATSPGEEYDFFMDCECSDKDAKEKFLKKLKLLATSVKLTSSGSAVEDEGLFKRCRTNTVLV